MKNVTPAALTVAALSSLANAQNPQPYCTAGASTNGCTPSIQANVQPNTADSAGCVITTSGVEGQRQGLVFYGVDNAGFTPLPWAAGSTSLLCVKPPTARLGAPQNSGGATGACNGVYVVSWDAFQLANPAALGNPWTLGDKVFLQSWYRDPSAPKTSNLSNALELSLRDPAPVCATTYPGLVAIPAGTFDMGSGAPNAAPYFNTTDQQPVHSVTLSYCFWMGETEVTQAQYAALMGSNPSNFIGSNHPVERVSWNAAQSYCAALTAQQTALGNVPPGYQYRLPTEAEWEYACRAGTSSEFNVGAALLCSQARHSFSTYSGVACWTVGSPLPVGSFQPNAAGLYDMHGNVGEWCLDSLAPYSAAAVTDPFVTGGASRIVRGGGFFSYSNQCRSAVRYGSGPSVAWVTVGFRVVLAPIRVP
jgi:formylglycine-generating enzyme required for sulfatase activity